MTNRSTLLKASAHGLPRSAPATAPSGNPIDLYVTGLGDRPADRVRARVTLLGGAEVVRDLARHGATRVRKLVLVGAAVPLLRKAPGQMQE